eukprot:TRINITY_DN3961_c0_g1_i1.p1 TRINITY_DN3961_c0_g1~~TRINITY_DN3961_c0_g1_i1.p1  ORF type:complete len:271 (+),score=-24.50 TRINITY_DN3961_c0_g1_i1:291-1103(+)
MVRCSNNLVGILNFVTFLLSIPIIGAGIWLARKAESDCEKFLEKPVIAIGVFLMVVSLLGLIGACCGVSCLLWIYLVVMFLLIVLLFCFTVFAFVVTNKGAGEVLSNKGYKDYKLGDYSNWLQKRVQNSANWRKIRSCIQDAKVCSNLEKRDANYTAAQFYSEDLSPIESGCCKPPTSCGLEYKSATVWTGTANDTSSTDCKTWNNDDDKKCYDCDSCKAGVIQSIKGHWRKVAAVCIAVLVFLVIVYSVGCCAFRNNRADSRFSYKSRI